MIPVINSEWMGAGQVIFIEGAGYYEVSDLPDTQHAVIINLGLTGNAAPNTTIGFPSKVIPGGQSGILLNAFTTTTASFVMPAVNSSVTIDVGNSQWTVAGAYIVVASAGIFSVSSVPNTTSILAVNTGATGNAIPTTVINSNNGVVPSGPQGPTGATGLGTFNSISITTQKGDLIVDNGAGSGSASDVRLGVGTNGQVLVANSTQASGLAYTTITPNTAATSGDIAVFSGTSGTPLAVSDSKLLITSDGVIQSTPTGGNARGSKATDLQVTRSLATEVASGASSVIAGGQNNLASGTSSSITGGNGNTASNTNAAICGGLNGVASGLDSVVTGGSGNTASNSYAFVGGGSGNLASSIASVVCGGTSNVSSAAQAATLGGYNNSATGGNSAIIGGSQANAYLLGQIAHACGAFATPGDCQTSDLIWHIITTDATANVELFLDGTAARAIIPNNTLWSFTVDVTARNSAGLGFFVQTQGAIQNNSNSVSLVAAVTQSVIADGTSGALTTANVVVDNDNTNKALRIRVTGIAAQTWRWLAKATLSEINY